jgi:hypothetical protein
LAAGSIRAVHAVPESHGEFQSLYLDSAANWLRPNLRFVNPDGSTYFDTNEIGLKGGPLDPRRKLAVVWGDSVVFGIGGGWPELLDCSGYQFLNGGIEGNAYGAILERAVKLNRERRVALNLILPGWHTIGINTDLCRDLAAALNIVPNPVLVTMPTALNRHIVDQDLTPFFTAGSVADGFYFCGSTEYSIAKQTEVFAHIVERNTIVGETAAAMGVPLIDLFSVFDTTGLSDFRRDFFDVMHPRPNAYPKIAQAVFDGIKALAAAGWEYHPPAAGVARQGAHPWVNGLRKFVTRNRAPI